MPIPSGPLSPGMWASMPTAAMRSDSGQRAFDSSETGTLVPW